MSDKKFTSDKSVNFQNLLIQDSVKKAKQNGGSFSHLKYSQTALDSKESFSELPNDSQGLIQTMMSFNKNNQQLLKKGNIVTFKSQEILQYQDQLSAQKSKSSQNLQRNRKYQNGVNSEQSQKQVSIQQKSSSQLPFTSAVSNHFLVPKKISSQVTLKTIINLNHGGNEKRHSINNDKNLPLLSQDNQNKHIPSDKNIVYVKDRFIDTRDQAKGIKRYQAEQEMPSLDSIVQQNKAQLSTAQNSTQKQFSSRKQNLSHNILDEGIAIGQLKYGQSSSLQIYKQPASLQEPCSSNQQPESPEAVTKTVTILKKPSSRHQPSRMKFITVTKYQQKKSLPSTPISNFNQMQEGFTQQYSNRYAQQGMNSLEIRPFSIDSSIQKRDVQKNLLKNQLKTQISQLKDNQSINELGLIRNFNNTSRSLVGEQLPSFQQLKQRTNSQQKLKTQQSAQQIQYIQDPLVNSVKILNMDQQNFLSRSINLINNVFPKGQSCAQIQQFESNTLNDISRSKKITTDKLEQIQTQKSLKRITFNLEKSDSEEDDKSYQNVPKKSYSYLKDLPESQVGSQENSQNYQYEMKNIEGGDQDELKENKEIEIQSQNETRNILSRESLRAFGSKKEINSPKQALSEKMQSINQLKDDLSNITEGESQEEQKNDEFQITVDQTKSYQKGIDIEKEIQKQKLQRQRTQQTKVQELISTIQNNAMENEISESRMQRSKVFNFKKQKSKILEEQKIQKKKQFEENLQQIKEKNEYKDRELDLLEQEYLSGGKFNQKNYNNLKINKQVKRSKEQIVNIFKQTVKLLQRLNINPQDVINNKIFSSRPYEKERSQEFFACVKANNVEQVSYLLRVDKFLVYDYDFYFMTPLHWACKRGLLKMVQLLIKFNSDLEAEDLVGRTPLFFAIDGNWEAVIECLLVNKASPYKTKYLDYALLAKTYVVSKMLSICRRLHWAIKLNPNPNKEEQWKKEVAGLYTIRQQQQYLEEEQIKKKELGLI
ncbi:hypothetical protein ABPG74_017819 [Tetrahymena malaccensis]